MKPIIGITGNVLAKPNETFDGNPVTYTPQAFVEAVHAVDGLAMVLPISPAETAKDYIAKIDKLLLTGGQDVTPIFYQEAPDRLLGGTDQARDEFELALLKEAVKQGKPVLGVCRGLQLINVGLGGTLYQDLSRYEPWAVKHNQKPTPFHLPIHPITTETGTVIQAVYGQKHQVNSYHHQAVKGLANGLTASAYSTDGLVEAFEWVDTTHRILGVQWHPELRFHLDAQEQELFNYFVNKL